MAVGWTDHPEDAARCGAIPGPVADQEILVRLYLKRVIEPAYDPFERKQLWPKGEFSNVCSASTGISVDRHSGELPLKEIRAACAEWAGSRPNREPDGALVATASAVRTVEVVHLKATGQLLFVYDDPIEGNGHAVIRGAEGVSIHDQDEIRAELSKIFRHIVKQV